MNLHAGTVCIVRALPARSVQIVPLVLQGSVLVGPGLHFWYGFIGRTVTATGTTGIRHQGTSNSSLVHLLLSSAHPVLKHASVSESDCACSV